MLICKSASRGVIAAEKNTLRCVQYSVQVLNLRSLLAILFGVPLQDYLCLFIHRKLTMVDDNEKSPPARMLKARISANTNIIVQGSSAVALESGAAVG